MSTKLPDFLVIGGMRCGSTTLHNVMSVHPELFLPKEKELHFFDRYNEGLGDDIDAYKKIFEHVVDSQLCGEVTPDYLTTQGAFEYISDTFQALKIIVILREPVARVCSHYLMSCAAGFEVLPFEQAIASEKERLVNRNKVADIFHSYCERSTYIQPLKKYSQRFGKENIHIVFLEELNNTPIKILAELWHFLGVESLPEIDVKNMLKLSNNNADMFILNKNILYRKANFWLKKLGFKNTLALKVPAISQESKQMLFKNFDDHNLALSKWLGRELPW